MSTEIVNREIYPDNTLVVVWMDNNNKRRRVSIIVIVLTTVLVLNLVGTSNFIPSSVSAQQKKQVMLTAMLTDLADPGRWKSLFQPAMQELKARHPDINIQINYTQYPYNTTRSQLLTALASNTPVDLISVDQIWLGDFAERGYLTDLTDRVQGWGRASDWYQANFDGGVYKGKVYGIWAWTDVRAIWYWKDLLNQARVDPNSLTTWDGYIKSIKKLNGTLKARGIEGANLPGLNYSPDIWYPYLWMLGGDILVQKDGHPTKGTYWFPAYNSSAGVRAMDFIQRQVDAGIKPEKVNLDKKFENRTNAVLLSGSWMPGEFNRQQWPGLKAKVGFIPMFPVPNEFTQNATMMGGWELSIPQTSKNKDLAWELITLMLEPRILSPWLEQYGYLPTQKTIGEGPYSSSLNQTIPYYDKMVSMITIGRSRPNIPEYPLIADHVKQAIDEVYYGIKEPKQALDEAAAKSAKVLGW